MCEQCWANLRVAPQLQERYASGHAITWACAVDRYEGPMKDIIHSLKYEHRRSIATPLGQLMRERGAELLRDANAVVPVPLHPRREYERGFNQAEDLAAHLGPPVMRLLVRVRHTHSQIELPRHQRQENVKDAFAFRPDPRLVLRCASRGGGSLIPAPCIAVLVDDVSTTGATLEACARVLKSAGVKEVRALTAARVVSERR